MDDLSEQNFPIGTRFTLNGEELVVVKQTGNNVCKGCVFRRQACHRTPMCSIPARVFMRPADAVAAALIGEKE